MVSIVASPNWYNIGSRNDNVLIDLEGDSTPARVEAIYQMPGCNIKRMVVRYYRLKTPNPARVYGTIIHRLYSLHKDPYLVEVLNVHDHCHMVPCFDRPGLFFMDITVLRDMSV
jgi:hypothetical protein